MSERLVEQAAALCDKGNFDQAIELIESNLDQFNEVTLLLALLQAFYTAKAANDPDKAKILAKLIALQDPEIPSIQEYLD